MHKTFTQQQNIQKIAKKLSMKLLCKKIAQKIDLSTKVPIKIAQTGWTINGKNQQKACINSNVKSPRGFQV